VKSTATIYSQALPKDDLSAAELWEANFKSATAQADKAKAS